MYMLFATWITLGFPNVNIGEHFLYVYKDKEECEWAKEWVEQNNPDRNRFIEFECREV